MKLRSIHVTNFRSVEDSGKFLTGGTLCLVGKNEAGKSAILQALGGLNPHPSAPIVYDREKDYPRRKLTEYKSYHPKDEAQVISTEWDLTDAQKQQFAAEFGEGVLKPDPIVVSRRYGASGPSVAVPIDIKRALQNLTAKTLTPAEREPLAEATDTTSLRTALSAIASKTEPQTALLAKLDALPNKTIAGAVNAKVTSWLPQFLYYSHYDRMEGQIRLDTFPARLKGEQGPVVDSGERVFVDFLEYAGTSVTEIIAATTYESLNARCEAASNRISEQLQAYWTQNPHLEIEVRVTKAESGDKPPYNEGIIARARVKNNVHKLTLPFSERSAGFVWFFSFLVKFSQVRKTSKTGLVLLLDEPGLTLHGKAQADLLRYFEDQLAPAHQVIFSTHSPFMVPTEHLADIRVVEDKLISPRPGVWTSEGTKVRDDALALDRDTLFPLQGALGYEITQSLFIGKNTLLVEGPGDIVYLQVWSAALRRRNRTALDRRWTICPAGGIDKIQSFVALFAGARLNIAAITDYSKHDKKKLENLRRNNVLESSSLLTFATVLELEEADVEDIFEPEVFCDLLNEAFALSGAVAINVHKLDSADETTSRLVKKAEALFRTMPPEAPQFDHFTPADWLLRNPTFLDADTPAMQLTLNKAEKVIQALNAILPKQA